MAQGANCGNCRYFDNRPGSFEAAFPGIVSFGSGNASVRDEDGICRLHERHLSPFSRCSSHAPATVPAPST